MYVYIYIYIYTWFWYGGTGRDGGEPRDGHEGAAVAWTKIAPQIHGEVRRRCGFDGSAWGVNEKACLPRSFQASPHDVPAYTLYIYIYIYIHSMYICNHVCIYMCIYIYIYMINK